MNQEKAREFFSAYFEGSLEGGLRQTFEQRLKADPQLQAEYQSFQETMAELDTLKFEEIEVPMYLSDRIATRLEEVQEKSRAKAPGWTIWLRGLAFSGLAAAAIFGAIFQMNRATGPSTASVGLGSPSADALKLDTSGSDVVMNYQAAQKESLSISSAGTVLKTLILDAGQQVQSSLGNVHRETAVFEVKGSTTTFIAVPGTQRQTENSGSGSVKEFIASLAGYYRVPVQLEVSDPSKLVTWSFDGSKAMNAANSALQGAPYSVVELETGVIEIKDR